MPPAFNTQNVITLVWDFDKTLIHGYMQDPLFQEYGVDPGTFWAQNEALAEYYARHAPGGPYRVGKDTIYLNHILTYVREGLFAGLTNEKLRNLGARIQLAPGLPEFFDRMRDVVKVDPYVKHDISVEHYIVSTGLRPMIEGCAVAPHIDGLWACELLPAAPRPTQLGPEQPALPVGDSELIDPAVVCQVGYTIDNTSKTRAIFEINKGVHKVDGIDVNAPMPEDARRVPMSNMIYIADGPSDVPSFSLVKSHGGKTLGVYAPGQRNFENAALLEEQSRVQHVAEADYRPDKPADMWLRRSILKIADRIVANREQVIQSFGAVPGHVVAAPSAAPR